MDEQAISATAGHLFRILLECPLTEAEVVKALAIAITMRLAIDTQDSTELIAKLEALAPFVIAHAKTNLEAFAYARAALKEENL